MVVRQAGALHVARERGLALGRGESVDLDPENFVRAVPALRADPAALALEDEANKVVALIGEVNRARKALIELRVRWEAAFGRKRGFPRWASERFAMPRGTIGAYMAAARAPEAYLERHRRDSRKRYRQLRHPAAKAAEAEPSLETLKAAWLGLSEEDRFAFIAWAASMLRKQAAA